MNILCIGDVVAAGGCEVLKAQLPKLKREFSADLCVVNAENSAVGNGILPSSADAILNAGADLLTGGTHSLKRPEIYDYIDRSKLIIRPYNLADAPAGRGYHTIEFPFYYIKNGINILRDPVCCNADGSIEMTSDVKEGAAGRLAYGDPQTILDSVADTRAEVARFSPEVILIFSCAGRRMFWGDDRIGRETQPFESLAPTFGFFTSSEFLRTNGFVNQHNVTLVIAAMREDAPKENVAVAEKLDHTERISMIHRLATFINMATSELEQANRKLREAAITDALTGLYNRGETQRRIEEMADNKEGPFSLIMIDLDDFKKVNDTYGHEIGDEVLTGLADFLQVSLHAAGVRYQSGRWGGEEFMVILPGMTAAQTAGIAETLRNGFAAIEFKGAGRQTMSLGVTEYVSGEDADDLCIRVDDALYEAKRTGKNRVVVK